MNSYSGTCDAGVIVTEKYGPSIVSSKSGPVQTAFLLREWIDTLGGYKGDVQDPWRPGVRHAASLEQFKGREPSATWLQISVAQDRQVRREALPSGEGFFADFTNYAVAHP